MRGACDAPWPCPWQRGGGAGGLEGAEDADVGVGEGVFDVRALLHPHTQAHINARTHTVIIVYIIVTITTGKMIAATNMATRFGKHQNLGWNIRVTIKPQSGQGRRADQIDCEVDDGEGDAGQRVEPAQQQRRRS